MNRFGNPSNRPADNPVTGYPNTTWNGPNARAHRVKMRKMRQELENKRAARKGMPPRRIR